MNMGFCNIIEQLFHSCVPLKATFFSQWKVGSQGWERYIHPEEPLYPLITFYLNMTMVIKENQSE